MNKLKECRVLVTPTSYGRDDPRLWTELEAAVGKIVYNPQTRPLTATEVAELLPGCHGYIAGLDQIDRTALEAADELKVIARYGVGVDRVDLEAAREKGIIVTNIYRIIKCHAEILPICIQFMVISDLIADINA